MAVPLGPQFAWIPCWGLRWAKDPPWAGRELNTGSPGSRRECRGGTGDLVSAAWAPGCSAELPKPSAWASQNPSAVAIGRKHEMAWPPLQAGTPRPPDS